MEKNLEPYVIIKDEDITFKGDTPQEQELNKWLYHTSECHDFFPLSKSTLSTLTTVSLWISPCLDSTPGATSLP